MVLIVAAAYNFNSYVFSCDKIKCRYIQSNANFDFKADAINEPESNHLCPSSINFSNTKSLNGRANKICTSYISSSSIDQTDMDKMLDCAVIDLSENEIERVEKTFFDNHLQLESLNLNNNRLTFLPEHVFAGIANLKKLSLRNNFIEVLSCDLFRFNIKLEHIDFSNNQLTRVPPNVFNNLDNLRFASFSGNPCVDLAFPQTTLKELKAKLSTTCKGRDLLTFIISLIKISSKLQNGSFGLQEISKVIEHVSNASNRVDDTTESINSTLSLVTPAPNVNNDLEVLIVSLFWLIIPIILILFAIFTALAFVIYKKYFVYSVNISRRS